MAAAQRREKRLTAKMSLLLKNDVSGEKSRLLKVKKLLSSSFFYENIFLLFLTVTESL
jgi:hypothetical protein